MWSWILGSLMWMILTQRLLVSSTVTTSQCPQVIIIPSSSFSFEEMKTVRHVARDGASFKWHQDSKVPRVHKLPSKEHTNNFFFVFHIPFRVRRKKTWAKKNFFLCVSFSSSLCMRALFCRFFLFLLSFVHVNNFFLLLI